MKISKAMLDTQEFIRRAIVKHGNKYDYRNVVYVNIQTPVYIICPIHGEFLQTPKNHLHSRGCPKCHVYFPRRKRYSTESWIAKARSVHGDKYDYSKVEYIDCNTKICIICPIHGEFWQTPSEHLQGKGCSLCANDRKKMTLEHFIKCAIEIHGDKFDYSKVDYQGSQTKVCIICPEHGEFWITPSHHLNGYGCPQCAGLIKDTEQFICEAKKVHGDKYDYTQTEYIDSYTKVCVICPIHGEFWVTPRNHLSGCECPKCVYERNAKKRMNTQEDIINRFMLIHGDKYDYSNVEYKGLDVKVCIICPKHGIFWQTPSLHLDGHGCPQCSESKGERKISLWLKNHDILFNTQYRIDLSPVLFGRYRLKVDFFLPEHNTIIEYHGAQHYAFSPFFHRTEDKFQEQLERDAKLRDYCKQHGITLIEVPYTKYDNVDDFLKRKLKKICISQK